MSAFAVTAENITVKYGTRIAIDGSSFSIPKGSVTALIGPNGSGKSTLLNAIAGLHDPASGSLEVEAVANRIAFVLQSTKVNASLPISVREVVTMGRYAATGAYGRIRQIDREAVEEAMERTEVASLADRQLHDLSGGQRQRVFVAQGLAQEHDLLLLDEPMTGLDLPSAQALDEVIHLEQERGCTVVMSTHDLSEAQVADHVLLLSGRVMADGPPGDVLTPANLSDAYGQSLLHVDGDRLFVDDPHHRPVEGRHLHRDRTIHVETSQSDQHAE